MVLEVEGSPYQRLGSNLMVRAPRRCAPSIRPQARGFDRLVRRGGGHGARSSVPRRAEVIDHCFCRLGERGWDGEVGDVGGGASLARI
jgi:hypothetical protein